MEQLYRPRKILSDKHFKEDLQWDCTLDEFIIANKNIITAYVDRMELICFSEKQIPNEARANIFKNLMVAIRYPQLRHAEQAEICMLFDKKYRPETMPVLWHVKQLVYSDNIFEPLSHEELGKSIKGNKKRSAKNE